MIVFHNVPEKTYQVYDESILELGYPTISALKRMLDGELSTSNVNTYYNVTGKTVDLDYRFDVDLDAVRRLLPKVISIVDSKKFLYYFGGIVMCDEDGTIQREVSSCYKILTGKKMESVTNETIHLPTDLLENCNQQLPGIQAGKVLQYFTENSKEIIYDTGKMMVKIGFLTVGKGFYAAKQQKPTGDLIFIVGIERGRALRMITMKYDDILGLLQFRRN